VGLPISASGWFFHTRYRSSILELDPQGEIILPAPEDLPDDFTSSAASFARRRGAASCA
jgi:hypothetical protein